MLRLTRKKKWLNQQERYKMAQEFQLTFRSDDEDSKSAEVDLKRMLNLAGVAVAGSADEQGCESCGSNEHAGETCPHVEPAMEMMPADDMQGLDEEQAEYDYGQQDVDEEGHEVDPSTYIWNGSKLPQRLVKGTQGDNPLVSEIHDKLLEQYDAFLTEADRENEDGTLSPLSDPTKPEFDKDPLSGKTPVDDGSHSPMSTIARQAALK